MPTLLTMLLFKIPTSWGWWVVNGATSLLENWDLKATRDISDNHIMFGEIGAWPYKALGGIFPDENNPGFKNIILRPNFVRNLIRLRHAIILLTAKLSQSGRGTRDAVLWNTLLVFRQIQRLLFMCL